jgi:hypothetical protein
LRSLKYEAFLDERERGASVSFRRNLEGDERAVAGGFLRPDDKCITLRTGDQTYKLDVRKVDPSELSNM